MTRTLPHCLALLLALAPTSGAFAEAFLRLDDYDSQHLLAAGFELPRKTKVEIDALGVRERWGNDFVAYAWILDSKTRKVVWSQEDARSERDRGRRYTRRSHDTVDLEAGRYELYAWAGWGWQNGSWSWNDHKGQVKVVKLGDLRDLVDLADWHDGDSRDRRFNAAVRDCYVELAATGLAKTDVKAFEPQGDFAGAVYRANRLGNSEYLQTALQLDKAMDLRLYGVVEWPREWDEPADGAYLMNADTFARVWEPSRRKSDYAGGAEKNRTVDEEVHLEAGRYVLCVGTDDSHSYDEFNAAPPGDPQAWGLTVFPGKAFEAAAFHATEKWSRGEPAVDLTRARDNDFLERRFKLDREGDVLVYALGEWDDNDGEFADRGWISRAGSRDVVWEMNDRDMHQAGGAEKNRMFEGLVHLPAGEYVAHYETDGSHSYRRWNSAAPWDPEAWGLALYPGRGLTSKNIQVSDLVRGDDEVASSGGKPADALVAITRVRDREHERDTFTLDKQTRVHIYALGEGVDRSMADYGWIEDKKSGDVVWEMTWRNTRPAGGAAKNREFNGDVLLDAGTYEVHYVTDGSHSFGDWNDRRPPDPGAWGITVTRGAK